MKHSMKRKKTRPIIHPEHGIIPPERNKELVSLLMKHQRRIFSYIYTMVPNREDSEDLLQETCLTICEKFTDFAEGTNFLAWACQIAFWKVRAARKKFATAKVIFNQELMDTVSDTMFEMAKELDVRHESLNACLQKLNERDRIMIMTRYEPGCNAQTAYDVCGRSIQATYKALSRIRKLLFDCVTFEQAVRDNI
jgi:RNA polymerase sigma-70 factor (ECF subfamily)